MYNIMNVKEYIQYKIYERKMREEEKRKFIQLLEEAKTDFMESTVQYYELDSYDFDNDPMFQKILLLAEINERKRAFRLNVVKVTATLLLILCFLFGLVMESNPLALFRYMAKWMGLC